MSHENLKARTKRFALDVICLCATLRQIPESRHLVARNSLTDPPEGLCAKSRPLSFSRRLISLWADRRRHVGRSGLLATKRTPQYPNAGPNH